MNAMPCKNEQETLALRELHSSVGAGRKQMNKYMQWQVVIRAKNKIKQTCGFPGSEPGNLKQQRFIVP